MTGLIITTMLLYAITIRDPIGGTKKREYFTNCRKAHEKQWKLNKKFGAMDDVQEVDFILTKKGVCELLNKIA